MAVTLTNQAKHLLIVQLNDGGSVYLAPGETSGPLDEAQLSGSERLERMLREGLIASAQPQEKEAEPPDATAAQPKAAAASAAEQPATPEGAEAASAAPPGATPPMQAVDTNK